MIAAIDNGLAFPIKHPDEWRTCKFFYVECVESMNGCIFIMHFDTSKLYCSYCFRLHAWNSLLGVQLRNCFSESLMLLNSYIQILEFVVANKLVERVRGKIFLFFLFLRYCKKLRYLKYTSFLHCFFWLSVLFTYCFFNSFFSLVRLLCCTRVRKKKIKFENDLTEQVQGRQGWSLIVKWKFETGG